MALLFDARWYAHDDDGNPLVGATLTVYTANTVNLAAIKRDAAFAVPMTNPTSGPDVSDAAGIFPQIFAPEGGLYDILLKDSAGNLVRSYDDVSFLGADTGDFSRTLADDTRITITGSGGRVLIQAGDADPDSSGGKLTIEGQAGTQLDDLLLDAASIDTTGPIKESGKKLSSVIYTAATQVTAQTSVDITLPNTPATTRDWEVEIFDYSQAGSGSFHLQMAYDGAPSTFANGASDYASHYTFADSGTSTVTNAIAVSTRYQISSNLEGPTNKPARGLIRLTSPASGNDAVQVWSRHTGIGPSSAYYDYTAHGYGPTSKGHLAAIRLVSTVAVTFKYIIRPMRGFGEA